MAHAIDSDKIKQIFNKMEYEDVPEGCNLAMAWLEKYKFTFNEHTVKTQFDVLTVNDNLQIKVGCNSIEDVEPFVADMQTHYKNWLNLNVGGVKLMNSFAAEIERHAPLIAQLEMLIRNILIKDTKNKAVPVIVDYLQYYSGWIILRERSFMEYVPYGTCCICLPDDNTALALFGMCVAPALAAGNVVVLEVGSRLMPVMSLFVELCENVGFPKGTIKLMTSNKETVLFKHDNVHKYTYIGNLTSNVLIGEEIHLTSLHLGKSTMIVFSNADLDSAIESVIDAAWSYNGQLPWSINKLLLQETIFDDFIERLKTKINKLTVDKCSQKKTVDVVASILENDPNSETINNLSLIIENKTLGSNILTNNEFNEKGLTILAFRTANEAAALANNTQMGLAMSIWSENINLVNEMTSKLKTGIIWVNNHGVLNAPTVLAPRKESGKGYFGGKEGLMEYLKFVKYSHFSEIKTKKISSHLPAPKNTRTLLYYNGTFKKSESGLTDKDNECPNKKDIRNCVEGAKKAFEIWNKTKPEIRAQHLRKLGDASASLKHEFGGFWAETLYSWSSLANTIKTCSNSSSLKIIREPIGIIAMEVKTDINLVELIIAALACGNALILFTDSSDIQDFLIEVCKILPSGIPAGLFNLITNPNNVIISTLTSHREVDLFFKVPKSTEQKLSVLQHAQNICAIDTSSEHVINMVTKTKSILSTNVESFL